jgi:hypothetical protein
MIELFEVFGGQPDQNLHGCPNIQVKCGKCQKKMKRIEIAAHSCFYMGVNKFLGSKLINKAKIEEQHEFNE